MSLDTNLVAWWKLDEASGSRVDATGGGLDLTVNGGVTQVTGKVGSAAHFEAASNQYLSRASSAELQTGDIDFTFAFWLYLDSLGTQVCIGKAANSYGDEFLVIHTGSRIQFWTVHSGPNAVMQVAANSFGAPSAGAWMFVVCWHDAAADTINIQINNGPVDSAATGGIPPNVSTNSLLLGAYSAANLLPTDGRMDEVGFWKRVLTSQERADLWNGGNGTSYPFSQSVSITGSGGIQASGAAATSRGAARTGTGGLQASGAATVKRGRVQTASGGLLLGGHGFWLVPLEYQIRLRAERRHHVLAAENRNRTPRFENRRAMAKESRS